MTFRVRIVPYVYSGNDAIYLVFGIVIVLVLILPVLFDILADRRKRKKEESEE